MFIDALAASARRFELGENARDRRFVHAILKRSIGLAPSAYPRWNRHSFLFRLRADASIESTTGRVQSPPKKKPKFKIGKLRLVEETKLTLWLAETEHVTF